MALFQEIGWLRHLKIFRDMPEFISVNEKYIPYIFVGILFIAFVILTVGWLNSLLRVDYAQIKDELCYLRITTFH